MLSISINESAGGSCILANHFSSYSPYIGYTYDDVIQLKCGDWSMFYAKGLGKVVGQNITTINGTTYYSIVVYNN